METLPDRYLDYDRITSRSVVAPPGDRKPLEPIVSVGDIVGGIIGSSVVRLITGAPAPGEKGADGAQGERGSDGAQGPAGADGAPGPAGASFPGMRRTVCIFSQLYGAPAFVPGTALYFGSADRTVEWDPYSCLPATPAAGSPFFVARVKGRHIFEAQVYLHSVGQSLRGFSIPIKRNGVLPAAAWVQAEVNGGTANSTCHAMVRFAVTLEVGDTLTVDLAGLTAYTGAGDVKNVSWNPGWDAFQLAFIVDVLTE